MEKIDRSKPIGETAALEGYEVLSNLKVVLNKRTGQQLIVDTLEPPEPPKTIEYDPEDYTVLHYDPLDGSVGCGTEYLTTKDRAEVYCALGEGALVVRVRTTPPPVYTARYIHLWRSHEGARWLIYEMGDGRQEFTWDETKNRMTDALRCAVKVRD